MLGTAIFDLSLLAGYDGYEAYKLCKTNPLLADFIAHYNFSDGTLIKTPLSIKQTAKLCADMRYCLAKMTEKEGSETSGTSSEYKNIADKYSSLTDKFEIMEEFLSHFELINKYLIEITDDLQGLISKYLVDIIENILAGLLDIPVYVYNKKYCILAFDKSFKIDDQTIDQIIKKFYKQCSVLIAPDKNLESQKRATGVQQKLNAWKKTMYAILEI